MLKIRCSAIGQIMTEPKSKSSKEAGELGETAKSYIDTCWLRDHFGYQDEPITDEIYKGLLCEQDSMELVQQVLGGEFRITVKNNPKYNGKLPLENNYLTGIPDILLSDTVEDVKTSFNIKTFFNAELSPAYEYQLRGYMALTGMKKARLIYCLVETPDRILTHQKNKYYFQFDCDESHPDYIRISKQIEQNDKLPLKILQPNERIKVFNILHDPEIEARIYQQVEKCRKYYEQITL